jgi:hypothetical protein
MNHLLYEVKRCSNLDTLSKAINGIATKCKKECISLKTFAPISGNSNKLDTLYQKHYAHLSAAEITFAVRVCESAKKYDDMAELLVKAI